MNQCFAVFSLIGLQNTLHVSCSYSVQRPSAMNYIEGGGRETEQNVLIGARQNLMDGKLQTQPHTYCY